MVWLQMVMWSPLQLHPSHSSNFKTCPSIHSNWEMGPVPSAVWLRWREWPELRNGHRSAPQIHLYTQTASTSRPRLIIGKEASQTTKETRAEEERPAAPGRPSPGSDQWRCRAWSSRRQPHRHGNGRHCRDEDATSDDRDFSRHTNTDEWWLTKLRRRKLPLRKELLMWCWLRMDVD